MVNEQLVNYVRAQRSNGLSKEAILQALAAGGWTAADVNEAFMVVEGITTPPPPPPQAPPPPPPQTPTVNRPSYQAPSLSNLSQQGMQPRVIIPPPGAPMVNPPAIGGPGVAPVSPRPMMSSAEYGTAQVKKSHLGLWILLVLLVLVGGVAAAVYMNPTLLNSVAAPFSSFLPAPSAPDDFLDSAHTPTAPVTNTNTTVVPAVPIVPASSTATSTATSSHR